jgi:GSCFA family
MLFRTELNIPPATQKIDHNDTILLIGSCFSQNISERLQKYKFKCISNPFGTVFNPVSISKLIQYTCDRKVFSSESLQNSQGVWVHPDFHSVLSDVDKDTALDKINRTIEDIHVLLSEVKYIFITLGTVTAYSQKSDGSIVANCHKIHPGAFTKETIQTEDGYVKLATALNHLKKMHPQINIVTTVSPVRHIKDGIIENARSKASLLRIVEMLEGNDTGIAYFPAYEWVMDDLRDYRYYGPDLIHPNEQAIDYIWEKFVAHYFSSETVRLIEKIDRIIQSCSHRPFNAQSDQHQQFIREVKSQIQQLQISFPSLNFEQEIAALEVGKR